MVLGIFRGEEDAGFKVSLQQAADLWGQGAADNHSVAFAASSFRTLSEELARTYLAPGVSRTLCAALCVRAQHELRYRLERRRHVPHTRTRARAYARIHTQTHMTWLPRRPDTSCDRLHQRV